MSGLHGRYYQYNSESEILWLPDQDSNLDKRYQKPSYYLYTIGQFKIKKMVFLKWNANIA